MKLSNIYPAVAILILKAIAHPAPLPASTHLPVLQDPSPPRPFPKYALEGKDPISSFPTDPEHEAADPFVVTNDPSPPRPFPKYPLVEGNALEERVPLALSRFPTDGEDEANDPSPPRPFPAGRIFATEGPSPPLERTEDPKAPHKIEVDYIFEAGNALEKRGPLSRFPTGDEKEANDPSPPRPFPPGRISEADDSSPSHIIEPRIPLPPLRTTEGFEAEANDPSPPRPSPSGQVAELKPRGEDIGLSPSHAHGGYFPPSNPPVSEPTASATDVESLSAGLDTRRCPDYVQCGNHTAVPPVHRPGFITVWSSRHTTANPNTTASKTQAANPLGIHYLQPPRVPLVPLPNVESQPARRPHHRVPVATAFAPRPTSTFTSNATSHAVFNCTTRIFSNTNTTNTTDTDIFKYADSGPHSRTVSLNASEVAIIGHGDAATVNVTLCYLYPMGTLDNHTLSA